ncbi:MAG: hypothetical protein ABFD83_14665 [Armatimonadota bacterium]
MKKQFIAILVILLCGAIFFARGCNGNRRFVDRGIEYIVWSKDSQALFYSKSQHKLYRYDVRRGDRRSYKMPDRLVEFDVSPDGRSVVFPMVRNNTYGMYVLKLDTQKTKRVSVIKNAVRESSTGRPEKSLEFLKRITDISWLPQNDVIIVFDVGKGVKEIDLLHFKNGRLDKLRGNVTYYDGASKDGKLLLYEDLDSRIHLYNLETKKDRRLDLGHHVTDPSSIRFLYLSSSQLLFTYDKPKQAARTLDLATMQVKPINLPDVEGISCISGDLARCLSGTSAHPSAIGGWTSNKVYVTKLPDDVVRTLCRLEH